jgi:hypothetical protein
MDRPGLVSLPRSERPLDPTPVHTVDLPATPTRDRNIPATAWLEATPAILELGEDLEARPPTLFIRRIGPWLLWRAGPPVDGDTRYGALHEHHNALYTFRLQPDGTGDGRGPTGRHTRFRTWKEDLRDHPG